MSAIQSSSGQDFDLNIAPIIDCFTVLITYLLVSASFLSLTVLDVGVAASGDAAPPPEVEEKPPEIPVNLGVNMKQDGGYEVKITGGPQNLDLTYPANGVEALLSRLGEVRTHWPSLNEASISAEPSVQYRQMIKLIEQLKKSIPKVFLAGT